MVRRTVVTVLLVLFGAAGVAPAQAPVPAKPQTESLDSEAPPGSPPHWLPNEPWVMQHWLPYDEARLYRLLRADRDTVWRWLRDDTRALADLARERGWDPAELARELVAPWRRTLKDPSRLALLERRALRTLTQGHLAQHVFFHSLHQNAVPDNAPAIFGTASREQFQLLRRSELSPLQICRLNGLSGDHARREAERTLRAYVQRAVDGEAMPAAQGRRLLARQLRQLPRWLNQTRYNGPPPVRTPRASPATASNYSNNAVLSAGGEAIAYEGYEAKLADAKRRGEINVLGGGLWAVPSLLSVPRDAVREGPRSSYNPAISANGRWVAFESAKGNLNFAKRYGKMEVFLRDARRGVTRRVTRAQPGAPRSTYNPSVSGDGRRVAYESSEEETGTVHVYVTDVRGGRSRRIRVPGALLSEPRLSLDGRFLVVSAATPGSATRVLRRDLRTGRTIEIGGGDGDAFEPDVSGTGRMVAFTSLADGLAPGRAPRQSRVFAHDARTGETVLVAPRPGDGITRDASAGEPAVSADGRSVAFTVRTAAGSSVYVHDLASGRTELVSRAATPAAGSSSHPSISGDGRRVAFTSDAWNLSERKCNAARGVFVRDRDAGTTTLVSEGDGANRYLGPTKGSSQAGDMTVALVCA
jgi:Tol biopolymer transport system component